MLKRKLSEGLPPEIEQRLQHLASLLPNWDSYGASPMYQLVLEKTRELLTKLYSLNFLRQPLPFIIMVKGGKMNSNAADNKVESEANWDWTHPEIRPPVPGARVVVSVSLSREQFILISECAERLGKSLSQFIREAAIDRVSGGPQVFITSVGP